MCWDNGRLCHEHQKQQPLPENAGTAEGSAAALAGTQGYCRCDGEQALPGGRGEPLHLLQPLRQHWGADGGAGARDRREPDEAFPRGQLRRGAPLLPWPPAAHFGAHPGQPGFLPGLPQPKHGPAPHGLGFRPAFGVVCAALAAGALRRGGGHCLLLRLLPGRLSRPYPAVAAKTSARRSRR